MITSCHGMNMKTLARSNIQAGRFCIIFGLDIHQPKRHSTPCRLLGLYCIQTPYIVNMVS
jgi:hypothetical protein